MPSLSIAPGDAVGRPAGCQQSAAHTRRLLALVSHSRQAWTANDKISNPRAWRYAMAMSRTRSPLATHSRAHSDAATELFTKGYTRRACGSGCRGGDQGRQRLQPLLGQEEILFDVARGTMKEMLLEGAPRSASPPRQRRASTAGRNSTSATAPRIGYAPRSPTTSFTR